MYFKPGKEEYYRSTSFRLLLIFFFGLLFIQCENEDPLETGYLVPDIIQPYVDRFVSEAELRGVHINTDHLTIEFGIDLVGSASGECSSNSSGTFSVVTIDTTLSWWNLGELSRECLIFHELGHCLLGRPHFDDLLSNDDKVSIMTSESPFTYLEVSAHSINWSYKRDYYLDELFLEKVNEPCWANPEQPTVKHQILLENYDLLNIRFRNIISGADGNEWIGTYSQLLEYKNGVFKEINSSNSNLPSTFGVNPSLDNEGNIWVAGSTLHTEENFLHPFVAKHIGNNKFEYILEDTLSNLRRSRPEDFHIDQLGNKWLGLFGGDLIKIDKAGNIFHFTEDNSDLPGVKIRKILSDDKNNLYFLSDKKLIHHPGGNEFNSFFPVTEETGEPIEVNQIAIQKDQKIYVSAVDKMWEFELGKGFTTIDMLSYNLPSSKIYQMGLDQFGNLAVATEHGFRILVDNRRFTDYCDFYLGEDNKEVIKFYFGDHGQWIIARDLIEIL